MKFGGQIRNIVVNFRSDQPLAISGPGGPFMFDIIGPPGPLMPKHKWSY